MLALYWEIYNQDNQKFFLWSCNTVLGKEGIFNSPARGRSFPHPYSELWNAVSGRETPLTPWKYFSMVTFHCLFCSTRAHFSLWVKSPSHTTWCQHFKIPQERMKSMAVSMENAGVWHHFAFSPLVLDWMPANLLSLGYNCAIKTTKNVLSPRGNFIELCNDCPAVSKADQQDYILGFLVDF